MKNATDDPLDVEVDFSKGKPNPFWLSKVDRRCVRLLDKDIALIFPDNQAVNEALRTLVLIGRSVTSPRTAAKKPVSQKSTRKKARS